MFNSLAEKEYMGPRFSKKINSSCPSEAAKSVDAEPDSSSIAIGEKPALESEPCRKDGMRTDVYAGTTELEQEDDEDEDSGPDERKEYGPLPTEEEIRKLDESLELRRSSAELVRSHSSNGFAHWVPRNAEKVKWLVSMLPTWRFTYEEAETFLVEYGHITGPVLYELEEQRLVLSSYGKLRLTDEGLYTRKFWSQQYDMIRDCRRMTKWPYPEERMIPEKDLRISIAVSLVDQDFIRRKLERELSEVQGMASMLSPAAFAWHIQEALAQWCDSEETVFGIENLHDLLRKIAPRRLAMLIRSRNGAPEISALRCKSLEAKPSNVVSIISTD